MAGRVVRGGLPILLLALWGCPFAVTDRYSHEPDDATVHCDDGELDGDETDVDCGGPDCDPCREGRACLVDEDCASGVCDGDACAAE